jgi:hypothetical protein
VTEGAVMILKEEQWLLLNEMLLTKVTQVTKIAKKEEWLPAKDKGRTKVLVPVPR